MQLPVEPHPRLLLAALRSQFPVPIGRLVSPPWLVEWLRLEALAPVRRSEALRGAIRDLLRVGGYKPTGRGKPASEYLLRSASEGLLRSINPAVDVCNAVSLHSGLPISVVDAERLVPPLQVRIAGADERYVFNEAGQEIDVSGLLCLHDARGPCANAVKDAQRTKTHAGTRQTLSLIWGAHAVEANLVAAAGWYRELHERLGVTVESVQVTRPDSTSHEEG
jgi:DNA/RNA-binding domain of Phe-tRNA-synthetase-like protein